MSEITLRANAILQPVSGCESMGKLSAALSEKKICSVYGPDDTQRAHFLASLAINSGRKMLIMTPNESLAMRMTEDMNVMLDGCARFLPARDVSFVKSSASSHDLAMRRIEVIGACLTGKAQVLSR